MIDEKRPEPKLVRGAEGGAQAGGVFVVITATIDLLDFYIPNVPWDKVEYLLGTLAAFAIGGGLAHFVHQIRKV